MRAATAGDRQAGFALVEVIVSAVLLLTLALATIPLIEQSGARAGSNRARGVASSLAQADQDRMRQMTTDALANFTGTTTKTIDGTTFTIVSRSDWVRDASGFITCSADATRAEYMKIQSTITWPNMNGIDPVVVESIVAPGVTAIGPTKGTATVKLTKADGVTPASGIGVNLGSQSEATDAGGCALFAQVPAGAQTMSYNTPGWVDKAADQNHSETPTVVGGATTNLTGSYDRAGTIPVRFVDPATSTASSWNSMMVVNNGNGFPTPMAWPKTVSTTMMTGFDAPLFPFSTAYSFYAGNCTGNDPRTYLSTATNPSAVAPAGGTASAVNVPLRRYSIQVYKSDGTALTTTGRFKVTPNSDTKMVSTPACSTGTLAARTALATGNTKTFDLPFGVFDLCVDDGTGRSRVVKITNTPAGTTGTYVPSPIAGENPSSGYTLAADKQAGKIKLNSTGVAC